MDTGVKLVISSSWLILFLISIAKRNKEYLESMPVISNAMNREIIWIRLCLSLTLPFTI